MKSTTIQKFVQNGIAPLGVFCLLGLLAGCSGGGGISNPIALPIPSATASVSRVTAQVVSLPVPGSTPIVAVQWPAPSFVSTSDVVEYHILRNGVIVGTASKSATAFSDTGARPSFSYFAISANDDTRLSTVTASAPGAFTTGEEYSYRVTALYVTPESSSAATPIYAETSLGTSETVTP